MQLLTAVDFDSKQDRDVITYSWYSRLFFRGEVAKL